jgi:hypothetical protein
MLVVQTRLSGVRPVCSGADCQGFLIGLAAVDFSISAVVDSHLEIYNSLILPPINNQNEISSKFK